MIQTMNRKFSDFLDWFLRLFDISEIVINSAKWVDRKPNDFAILVFLAVMNGLPGLAVLWLAYIFDFKATWEALFIIRNISANEVQNVSNVIPLVSLGSLTAVILTLTPTFLEMVGGATDNDDVPVLKLAATLMIVFDVMTDIPHTARFIALHEESIRTNAPGWEWLAEPVCFFIMLALSTIVFEIVAVLLLWRCFLLILKAFNLRTRK